MKKKKILLILMMVIILIFLTGCVKFEMHVTINANNTADIKVTLLGNSMLAAMGDTSFDEMKTAAKEAGFNVTNQKEGDMTGYIFTKHVEDLKELSTSSTSSIGMENLFSTDNSGMEILTIEKGILFNTYLVELDMDLDMFGSESVDDSDFTGSMRNAMMSQMDFKFKMTLPVKPISSNANNVTEDGKTLEWQLIPGQKNTVEMGFKILNIANTILFASIGLVSILLVVIAVKVIKSRKYTKKEKESTEGIEIE